MIIKTYCFVLNLSALAIYSRSPSAYAAVKSLNILQLPCSKTLKKVIKEGAEGAGIDDQYMLNQCIQYNIYKKKRTADGFQQPLGLGVLMWDEVKVN